MYFRGLWIGQQLVEAVGGRGRGLLLRGRGGDRIGARLVALDAEPPDQPRQRQPVQQQRADHDDEGQEHDVRAAGERSPDSVVSGTANAAANETTPRMPAHATTKTCATVGAGSCSLMRGDSILGR